MAGPYVRRAGRAVLPGGAVLLWSIAEGRRGVRWRASTRRGEALLWDLLLEVGVDGRPGRLEIATVAGQLTLHPEPDQASAHGNVVSAEGVRPLAHPWSARHWFEWPQSPLLAVAMCRALRAEMGVGERRLVPGLRVDDALSVWGTECTVSRVSIARWRIEEADGRDWNVSLDDDGLPMFEADARRETGSEPAPVWPLEVDAEG